MFLAGRRGGVLGPVAVDEGAGDDDADRAAADPVGLLQRAGVDLSEPSTVRAVVDQLDGLVTRLDAELA